jgi:hypothetical protein
MIMMAMLRRMRLFRALFKLGPSLCFGLIPFLAESDFYGRESGRIGADAIALPGRKTVVCEYKGCLKALVRVDSWHEPWIFISSLGLTKPYTLEGLGLATIDG